MIWANGKGEALLITNHYPLSIITTNYSLYLIFQTFLIPLIEFLYAVFDFHFVSPSEAVELVHADELSWSAVGFAGVKLHRALEAYCLYHEL